MTVRVVYIRALDHASVRCEDLSSIDCDDVVEVVGALVGETERYYHVMCMRKSFAGEPTEYLVLKVLKAAVLEVRELGEVEL